MSLRGFAIKIEWDYLTKWDEKGLHVQSAKGEIESFRPGRARWGIHSFPLNRGSESLISLAALPEMSVCICLCALCVRSDVRATSASTTTCLRWGCVWGGGGHGTRKPL